MRYKNKDTKSIYYRREYTHWNRTLGVNIKIDVGCIRCKFEDIVGLAKYVVHCQVANEGNKERMGDHKELITRNFENERKRIKQE
jgi:hypothetical protein